MESSTSASGPVIMQPHVFAVGPSWIWMTIWIMIAGAMTPWIVAEGPAEIPLPWLGTVTLPAGVPLSLAITAGLFALICSLRCRVAIDENARTITRWRCIAVVIPWSVRTRPFEEVRFVRSTTHMSAWQLLLNGFLSIMGSDPYYPGPDDFLPIGSIAVQIVFDDRDWFNAARGSARRMVATAEEICRILEVRAG